MAKFQFDKSAKKKAPRPIAKTDIAKPKESYDPNKVSQQLEEATSKATTTTKKRPVGRPKSGRKSYQTVRLQKQTVLKINALENALSIATQDETVDRAIEQVLRSLSNDEKRAYQLWLDMFKKREKK
ncbi:replication-associated protein RepC [Ligilactobacillus saerimneri]|uniref:replication-associated protein RepC n=1 Tax=Ligilactobacillus saerimneri TaxID=228229 RepID=UPI0022A802A8|nr:replication-associated protein RepC [Ligilactobacillus saerimneri]MCZ0890981.1 replication-associated protein RepC [Ligilactobacillus saerimneri]